MYPRFTLRSWWKQIKIQEILYFSRPSSIVPKVLDPLNHTTSSYVSNPESIFSSNTMEYIMSQNLLVSISKKNSRTSLFAGKTSSGVPFDIHRRSLRSVGDLWLPPKVDCRSFFDPESQYVTFVYLRRVSDFLEPSPKKGVNLEVYSFTDRLWNLCRTHLVNRFDTGPKLGVSDALLQTQQNLEILKLFNIVSLSFDYVNQYRFTQHNKSYHGNILFVLRKSRLNSCLLR